MLLIGNGRLLTRDQGNYIENGAVAIEGNLILEVGETAKLKQKYRMHTQIEGRDIAESEGDAFEVDDQGHRIIETFQTIRSGFYLIDVPVLSQTS